MDEIIGQVKKIYANNSRDEENENRSIVRKTVANIEETLMENGVMTPAQTDRICEQLSTEMKQRIVGAILKSREYTGTEIAKSVEQNVNRGDQQEEEKRIERTVNRNVEDVINELKQRLSRILETSRNRYADDTRQDTRRILDRAKDSILETYSQYTRDNQRRVDATLEQKIDKTVHDFCKEGVNSDTEMAKSGLYSSQTPEMPETSSNIKDEKAVID